MIELQQNGKLKLENYGLMEWALDVQTAIKQGYELDHSNEGYCQNFGSLYTCLMVEQKVKVLPDKQAETSVVLPVDEAKDVLVGTIPKDSDSLTAQYVAQEATIVAEKETEVKRGPKPKNK